MEKSDETGGWHPGQDGNVLPADREQELHYLWPVLLALYLFLSLFTNDNIGPVG